MLENQGLLEQKGNVFWEEFLFQFFLLSPVLVWPSPVVLLGQLSRAAGWQIAADEFSTSAELPLALPDDSGLEASPVPTSSLA